MRIYVDEAGDTALRDPGNPVFVLAGCAVLTASHRNPFQGWDEVRRAVTGSPSLPIHMRKHGRRLIPARAALLDAFLREADFARLGVSFALDAPTTLDRRGREWLLKTTFDELLIAQADLARHASFDRLEIIFEAGPLLSQLEELFGGLTLMRTDTASGAVEKMPVTFRSLPKSALEIGLEVADVMAHTMAAYARSRTPGAALQSRHRAIFHPGNGRPSYVRQVSGRVGDPGVA